jgi:hypothetical protein
MFLILLGSSVVAEAAVQTFTGSAIASDTLGCGLGSEGFDLKIDGDEFQLKIRNFTDDRIITGTVFEVDRKIKIKWKNYTDFGNLFSDVYLEVRVFNDKIFHGGVLIINHYMDRDKERTAIYQIDLMAQLETQGRKLTKDNSKPGSAAENVEFRLKEAEEFFQFGFITEDEYAALKKIILK